MNSVIEAQLEYTECCPWRVFVTGRKGYEPGDFYLFERFVIRGEPVPGAKAWRVPVLIATGESSNLLVEEYIKSHSKNSGLFLSS